MVCLVIRLPPDPAPEDWAPLSRSPWSQFAARFGKDAPRSADGPAREEVILVHSSSGLRPQVTQSSLHFPETVPSSGSSVVPLVNDLLSPTDAAVRPSQILLPLRGDVEPDPGPPSGPSSVPLTHQEWLLGEFVGDPGHSHWEVRWMTGLSGPDGEEPRSPRGLLLRCLNCDATLYVRTPLPLRCHRCPPWSFEAVEEEDPAVEDEPPRTRRGDALLSNGDVESNPGPSLTRKDKGVVRPREHAHGDADMAPSAADPTFVPGCPGGPGDAVLPSYEDGTLSAPPPRRANPHEATPEDWDGDVYHQPNVSSDAADPKRGR